MLFSAGDELPETTAAYLQMGGKLEPDDELVCGPRVLEATCQRADELLGSVVCCREGEQREARRFGASWFGAAISVALVTSSGTAVGQEAGIMMRLLPASEAPVDAAVAWSRYDFPCLAESGGDCPVFALVTA